MGVYEYMANKSNSILSNILNFIKYPFLGLLFVFYNIFKFIMYSLKGILYVLYLITTPFIYLYKKLLKNLSKIFYLTISSNRHIRHKTIHHNKMTRASQHNKYVENLM